MKPKDPLFALLIAGVWGFNFIATKWAVEDFPPLLANGLLFAVAGFAAGCVAPSRDMMVRALTPPGQSGKVFGFVSTGYNLGGIVAPPVFGLILDQGSPEAVFWTVGAVALATVLTLEDPGDRCAGPVLNRCG